MPATSGAAVPADRTCPACGVEGLEDVYENPGVPVNSLLLLDDPDAARAFPTAPLVLAHCPVCGFLTNRAFDPAMTRYSADYEETQGFSLRFRAFAAELAEQWVQAHGLTGRHVLEIGCGKGEFLGEMVRAGIGSGTGYDPVFRPGRVPEDLTSALTFLPRNFTAAEQGVRADAVVCRHTLEHVPDVGRFLADVRGVVADSPGTVLLFEVPDVQRILDEAAFWDVFYEHCSYFSAGSLARLFERTGFEVLDVRRVFEDQYLVVEASVGPTGRPARVPSPLEDDMDRLAAGVVHFRSSVAATRDEWLDRIRRTRADGGAVVLWGSGSKSVAFLTALGDASDQVAAVVDINPNKQGTYNAGTGQRIIAPRELPALDPALVVVMNPVYEGEIRADLRRLGLDPEVRALS